MASLQPVPAGFEPSVQLSLFPPLPFTSGTLRGESAFPEGLDSKQVEDELDRLGRERRTITKYIRIGLLPFALQGRRDDVWPAYFPKAVELIDHFNQRNAQRKPAHQLREIAASRLWQILLLNLNHEWELKKILAEEIQNTALSQRLQIRKQLEGDLEKTVQHIDRAWDALSIGLSSLGSNEKMAHASGKTTFEMERILGQMQIALHSERIHDYSHTGLLGRWVGKKKQLHQEPKVIQPDHALWLVAYLQTLKQDAPLDLEELPRLPAWAYLLLLLEYRARNGEILKGCLGDKKDRATELLLGDLDSKLIDLLTKLGRFLGHSFLSVPEAAKQYLPLPLKRALETRRQPARVRPDELL